MNGIDISSHQEGIDLSKINGLDFVIVKASQGANAKYSTFKTQVEQSLALGKLTGVYHYISGVGVEAEANAFATAIKPYIGRVLVCVDWEKSQNSKWGDVAYLDALISAVKAKIGIETICLYSMQAAYPWAIAEKHGCTTWVAKYAGTNVVNEFQKHPWAEGTFSCDIRQYSGMGRLDAWNGNLDLDKAYMTAEQWMVLAAPAGSKPQTTPKQELSVTGYWDTATTKALQKALGTVQDGIVSGQDRRDFDKVNRGGLHTSTWRIGSGGSQVIKALQKKVGAISDGYFGKATCKALQSCLGTTQDGLVSAPSKMVQELQRRLTSGTF